ncbi:ATP-binding protein [Atopobiaceae bacterium HCP3S3_F7]
MSNKLSHFTSQFVANATDVILEGFTGTGKSHLACALGKQVCKHGLKTLYVRMPDMLAYRSEKMDAGWPEKKVLNKYAAYKVPIIDEHLIDKPTKEQMHFLLELTKRRYDNSSTIYCSQYGIEDWHRRMGGGAHAESVLDRIIHNAVRIEMGDVEHEQKRHKSQRLARVRSLCAGATSKGRRAGSGRIRNTWHCVDSIRDASLGRSSHGCKSALHPGQSHATMLRDNSSAGPLASAASS